MKPYIYLRALRQVDYSVFAVSEGQKKYYDPTAGQSVAFSAGQQVKRSIIDSILTDLNEQIAPVIFNYEIKDKKKVSEKEALSMADPSYTDQLLGGWMSAAQKSIPVKRRSPLSISAMRPLHPSLSSIHSENMTFDRSSHHGVHKIVVKDAKGNEIESEDLQQFLTTNQRTLPARKFLQDQKRTGGLFVYDIAIDLRTLFAVSINETEPELTQEVVEKLKSDGWVTSRNSFGECLVCPKERRESIIKALAKGLINWKITSNQARTYDSMKFLAVAVSQNANKITPAIRGRLIDEKKAIPVIQEGIKETQTFVTLDADGVFQDLNFDIDAIEKAEQHLIDLMMVFDYENQI